MPQVSDSPWFLAFGRPGLVRSRKLALQRGGVNYGASGRKIAQPT